MIPPQLPGSPDTWPGMVSSSLWKIGLRHGGFRLRAARFASWRYAEASAGAPTDPDLRSISAYVAGNPILAVRQTPVGDIDVVALRMPDLGEPVADATPPPRRPS